MADLENGHADAGQREEVALDLLRARARGSTAGPAAKLNTRVAHASR